MSLSSEVELSHWVSQVNRLWLFLDYDGTLVDLAPTPEDIKPDPQVFDLIDRLTGNPRLRVAIISGRRLSDILSLLPVPRAFLAGTYGIELQTPSAGRIERADYSRIRPILERLKPLWQTIIGGRSGFFLEDKGWALALHARYAEEVESMQVIASIWQLLNKVSVSGQFRIFTGYKFLEIAPALAHKGETISFLLTHFPWPGARPLYIGDDDKDEEAFDLIRSTGGVAVSVSHPNDPQPPMRADYTLESPANVRRWLGALV